MKINKETVKVGSDFELFLVDKNNKGISAIPFNYGTKENPQELERKGCCIQYDNVSQECNVPPVSLDEVDDFWENYQYVREHVINNIGEPNELELVCCPSKIFEDDQLQDERALQFGCDTDYNAWKGGEPNPKPNPEENPGLRCCGLHFHLSFDKAEFETCLDLVKLYDLFITLPFSLMDNDTERRKLYGKAGAYRLKDWGTAQGVEIRTLSNFALSRKEYIEYIFFQMNEMIDYYNKFGIEKVNNHAEDIVNAINNSDKELAKQLMTEFNIKIDPTFEIQWETVSDSLLIA